jgi:hypothetical protein
MSEGKDAKVTKNEFGYSVVGNCNLEVPAPVKAKALALPIPITTFISRNTR